MNEDQKNVSIFLLVVLVVVALKFEQQLASIFLDEDINSVIKIQKKYPKNEISVSDFKSYLDVKTTDVQRNEFIQSNKYKVVQWTGKVKNVKKIRGYYVVTLSNDFVPRGDISRLISDGLRIIAGGATKDRIDSICGELKLYPNGASDDAKIANFFVGQNFRYEALIDSVDRNGCVTAEYGILSKDQTRLTDSGYKSELMTSLLQMAEGVTEGVTAAVTELDSDSDLFNLIGKPKDICNFPLEDIKLSNGSIERHRVFLDIKNKNVIYLDVGGRSSNIEVYDVSTNKHGSLWDYKTNMVVSVENKSAIQSAVKALKNEKS